MESPASWFFTQTGKLWSYGPGEAPRPLEKEYKKAIALFYTGLKDKNNKEIYEGDILSADTYPFIDEGRQNYIGIVEWVFAGFQYILRCVNPNKRGVSDGINEPLEEGKEFEVLGNIYENPELLIGE